MSSFPTARGRKQQKPTQESVRKKGSRQNYERKSSGVKQ